ncbi:MAG TPA: NusG domain II-containing protein [Candidatus Limiplasma sp.]|nr:NusG domain II-containing protein [Candidatus Limiplasma sp.]
MKRRDWLILGIVLAASLILLLLRPQASQNAGTAYLRISVPGQTYQLVPLTETRDIVIEQADGSRNVVEIFPGGFRMKESNCSNQDCILQGDVTVDNVGSRVLANEVICLPHRVVLELVTADGQPVENTASAQTAQPAATDDATLSDTQENTIAPVENTP